MTRTPAIPLLTAALMLSAVAAAYAEPDYSQAIDNQRQRLLEVPSAATWNDLGALLVLTDDRDQAAEAFEQALELEPENAAALYNLGVLSLESDPGRSHKLLRSALRQNEDGWTHYRLGQAYELIHRERRAIRHYARAFELDHTLLYPEINPEIIANQLAMRSLLQMNTGRTRIEPRFVETVELRSMLLGEESVGDGGDEGDGGDDREQEEP